MQFSELLCRWYEIQIDPSANRFSSQFLSFKIRLVKPLRKRKRNICEVYMTSKDWIRFSNGKSRVYEIYFRIFASKNRIRPYDRTQCCDPKSDITSGTSVQERTASSRQNNSFIQDLFLTSVSLMSRENLEFIFPKRETINGMLGRHSAE